MKLGKINKNLLDKKPYKFLNISMIITYVIFLGVYVPRETLYKFDVYFITLFAGTAPNLIPSFLFTLVGIFYVVPIFFKSFEAIKKTKLIWLVNAINMSIFSLIEYLHVIFGLGVWDNKDMIASLIGILVATVVYFNIRKFFTSDEMMDIT